MKVITDYKQLEGKTIAFAHMAQFAEQITLVTTDGEVLMTTTDGDDFDKEILIYNKGSVVLAIRKSKYLQEELDKLGVFNLQEYKKELERRQQEQIEKSTRELEEKERKEYERLKAKFEEEA